MSSLNAKNLIRNEHNIDNPAREFAKLWAKFIEKAKKFQKEGKKNV